MKDTTRNTKCRRSSSPKTLNQQKQQRSCKSLPTNCTAGCKRWKQPSWSDATNVARKKRWALPKRISSWKSGSRRWKKRIAIWVKWMNFWRMQQLFSLPAVRSPERAAIEIYCISNRWRQKRRKNPLLLQSSGSQQTGILWLSKT